MTARKPAACHHRAADLAIPIDFQAMPACCEGVLPGAVARFETGPGEVGHGLILQHVDHAVQLVEGREQRVDQEVDREVGDERRWLRALAEALERVVQLGPPCVVERDPKSTRRRRY
jgi:hypothetical protein